ncbi:alpha-amylase family glycosyl hydrolase [Halospeciosus flavus]|uniref:Alpha-amylase family glycosyl hydrolase n=1 Tax=Halospeciosus flavus TaxID=3032283 RepID=A0ABD5Z166_9EURY|nr:alpha-amylase family glycosyl hydrolase [Halospeciosus flavus]
MPEDTTRRDVLKALGLGTIGATQAAAGLQFAGQEARAVTGGLGSSVDYTDDVIYQILTDRFQDGDTSNNPDGELYDPSNLTKYHGGDWRGIIQRIQDGYLTNLGVTALWISPPFENVYEIHPDYDSAAYHGFWIRDLKKPNPYFGDMSDFKELVSVAHDNDIKIIIDFVPNHSNPASETDGDGFMEEGALYDNGSFVADYDNDPNNYFRHNGGTDFSSYEDGIYRNLYDLADLDVSETYIDQYLKEAITKWLDLGVDGIRVDAVKHMPPKWQKVMMETIYNHAPVFTFGEWFLGSGQTSQRYYEFSNDSGMNLLDFRFGQKIRDVLRDRTDDFNGLHNVIQETKSEHQQVTSQVPFLDNHDMDRFTTASASTTMTDIALAVLLTSRGTPAVYYGTEQYMTGANESGNPENRKSMTSFDTSTTAYAVISKLAALRQSNPAIAYGDTQQRWINGDVYIYEREFGDNAVVVAVNRSQDTWYDINTLQTSLPGGSYADVLDGEVNGWTVSVNDDGSIDQFSFGPHTVSVWAHRGDTTTPTLGHVGPTIGTPGTTVTLGGEGFGSTQGTVRFGSTQGTVQTWSDDRIDVTIPSVAGGFYDVTVESSSGTTSTAFNGFEVLSGEQVTVRFIVDDATTETGENVYLTGNVHELGNWDTSRAVGPFFNQVEYSYPTWYYDVNVPAGQDIEFKFIKEDSSGNVTWESGSNHTYTTPTTGTAEFRTTW